MEAFAIPTANAVAAAADDAPAFELLPPFWVPLERRLECCEGIGAKGIPDPVLLCARRLLKVASTQGCARKVATHAAGEGPTSSSHSLPIPFLPLVLPLAVQLLLLPPLKEDWGSTDGSVTSTRQQVPNSASRVATLGARDASLASWAARAGSRARSIELPDCGEFPPFPPSPAAILAGTGMATEQPGKHVSARLTHAASPLFKLGAGQW